ncbi:MAG: glycerophosphodiester phosphodiesterase family protein [Ilumatobacteraceae bacterium]
MLRSPLLRSLAALGALTLLATSCTGDDSSSDTTAPATSVTDGNPSTTAAAPTTPDGSATTVVAERALDRVRAPEAGTVTDLLALDRPIVIAHAGGDFDAPHSTMYAFTEAALAGADVLEMDVMLTADHVLVVQHDDTVDRTTESTGRVRDLTYDQLSALDNAYWFSGDTWSDHSLPAGSYPWRGVRNGAVAPPAGYSPDDFRVETFRSVASAFPHHVLDIEVKIPTGDDGQPDVAWAIEGAHELAAELDELGRTGSAVVVSFDADVIAAFHEAAPTVATSPGLSTLVDWYAGADVAFAPTDVVMQVPPVYGGVEVLTPDVIARAHADGFAVWVWMDDTTTEENAAFYADLLGRGIDGLLVSKPALAVDVVTDSSS